MTWIMLKNPLKASSLLLWLCLRDFNEVLIWKEYMGINDRSNTHVHTFRRDICEPMDLGYTDLPWTVF
jgi:hypothetical protein